MISSTDILILAALVMGIVIGMRMSAESVRQATETGEGYRRAYDALMERYLRETKSSRLEGFR